MMNRVRRSSSSSSSNGVGGDGVLMIIISFFILSLLLVMMSSGVVGSDGEFQQINAPEDERSPPPDSRLQMLKAMLTSSLSATNSYPAAAAAITYWDRAKAIVNRVGVYFFPPNLDFRGGSGDEGREKEKGLKEAAAESFEKTKATVEATAKSAAKIATEAVHKTEEKLKIKIRSLWLWVSDHESDHAEL